MFNLGSDDKDELQENMKEIKDMIQREDRGSGNREVGDSFGDDSQDFGTEQDQNSGFDQSPSVPEGSPGGQQRDPSQEELGNSQDQAGGQQSQPSRQESRDTGIPDTGASKGQDTQRRQQPEKTPSSQSPGSREVVEQHSQEREQQQEEEQEEDTRREVIRSEPKKEIKKKKSDEPLFLKEEEFREVREMVEEMSYLSREMQDNLDRMKKSVRKERETSKNVNELIDAYSERRASIETAIETGQK